MKSYIVITSIFEPTNAIYSFSEIENHQLIVVGDQKTPADWYCKNVDYISMKEQDQMDFKLAKKIPLNHYSRKMLGYLKAIKNGASHIIDTDDDNVPKRNWGFPSFYQKFKCLSQNRGFINIYQLFTDQPIGARGLPLNLINKKFELEKDLNIKDCKIGVWQGLADEDPDVDAIYRLTNNTPCYFKEREPVVLDKGTISPFNSQNTIIIRELFPLLYLPTYVTFRFTDILRGLVAQPIMWLYGYKLGFCSATVIQKRNPHDYFKDFISEIPMYENCEKVVELVSKAIDTTETIETNLLLAYKSLLKENIVCDKEIVNLEAWLKDIDELNDNTNKSNN